MKTKIPIVAAGVMLFVAATAQATTVTVELPEFVGELQAYPNQPTAVFDLKTSFLQIDEVSIRMVGSFVPGTAQSLIAGQIREITPEISLYIQRGVGAFLYPSETPFDIVEMIELDLGATWEFLLDGKAQVSAYLGWGGAVPEVMITPGSVQISQAYVTVAGTVPEPTSLMFLALGISGLWLDFFTRAPLIIDPPLFCPARSSYPAISG